MKNLTVVDNFRFLNGLNTTVRILFVCSAIIKIIGTKQLPIKLIKNMVIQWSLLAEENDPSFQERKGKLTTVDKKTGKRKSGSAFEHYVELLISFGLLHRTGNVVSTTRIGTILIELNRENIANIELSNQEKIFYLNILNRNDADAILLLMNMLDEPLSGLSQKAILSSFKNAILYRLNIKKDTKNMQALSKIREWYIKITMVWDKPEIYSEHLLVPRLEWLRDFGLITIEREGSQTIYKLNKHGRFFYESIPIIEGTLLRDVNERWIRMDSTSVIVKSIYLDKCKFIFFADLSFADKVQLIGEQLTQAFKVIDTSKAFRISFYPAFLFISIKLAEHKSTILELSDLIDFLQSPINYNFKKYFLKESARINESYITLSI